MSTSEAQAEHRGSIRSLVGAAYGMHLADQIALVSVPLTAGLVFDASARVIGVLVACQSLGQLAGSIPFGILVDRFHSRWLVLASTVISGSGFAGAWAGIVTANLVLFGAAVTFAGFGIVMFVLILLSMLPALAGSNGIAQANASVEIPRSVTSFAVPLIVGATMTTTNAQWVFLVAVVAAISAFSIAGRLPDIAPADQLPQRPLARIVDGGRFVAGDPHLRAITLCSLAWNFAFVVLLVAMVPFLDELGANPGAFGGALASFGLAAILGSSLAGKTANRFAPKLVLVGGPATSIAATFVVLGASTSSPQAFIYPGFFILGLGPSMWLVAQNAVRQLVTPRELLGRVNAMIQTAIYGVRPIGALVGGLLVGATSPQAGLTIVAGAFALSTTVALFSTLRTIDSFAELSPRVARG